jgi:hypothetical protein
VFAGDYEITVDGSDGSALTVDVSAGKATRRVTIGL